MWVADEAARERVVEAALRPTPPSPSGADQLGLRVGDDVRHGKFGEGVILELSGAGEAFGATPFATTAQSRSTIYPRS